MLVIAQAFSLPDVAAAAHSTSNPSFIDLGYQAKLTGVFEDPNVSLHNLAGAVLKKSFTPPSSEPYPWSVDISLAAIHSLQVEINCIWQIWSVLSACESVGIRLKQDQLTTHGQLITLVQSCKPVANGFIIGEHPGYLDAVMDVDGTTRRINVSSSRSLIEITEVLVPLAIHTLHKQTIDWIFTHGKKAVVTSSQLRSRSSTPVILATNLTYGFSIPAPPVITTSEDESSFSITYDASRLENSSHTASEVQFDIWEPSENDLYMEANDLSDSDSDIEMEVILVFL